MKKNRPAIYLAIALAVAFVIFLIERPDAPRVNDASEEYFVPNFDTDKIARIEIEQLLDGCELKFEDGRWFVSEIVTPSKKELYEKEGKQLPEPLWRPADTGRIRGALGFFGGLEKGVMVSDNPDKQMLYQVNAMGLSVRAFDLNGKPVVDVIIGKNGPDFASSYIKNSKDNRVFLVRRTLTGAFSPRADDWLERTTPK